ncbi:MAG: tyrosine-type recombinase/integrase [Erysipelotrichaceae bacterium]|jgi:site-specific recombinase XerD|nr:tyrosine-type recombinase/integrase [Erysipelotrichaceae bacterium]
MELDAALKEYAVHIQINQGKSQRTVASYLQDLKQYAAYLKKHDIHDTKDISYSLIEHFIAAQSAEKSSSSIVRMAASIRSFHQDLAFMYNEKDPSLNLEVHKHSEALPIYCTIDEINMLMSSFDDTDPNQYLDHTILETIYGCGLRVSEVVSLTLSRVDLDSGKIRVLGKGDKERIVPIPQGSIPLLKYWRDTVRPIFLKNRSPLFFINRFSRPITPRHVELVLKNKDVELGFKKHITPHKLRHSYATHMLQGGADLRTIQEILGHANIQTTEIYTHIQNQEMFHSYQKYHPGESLQKLEILQKKETKK